MKKKLLLHLIPILQEEIQKLPYQKIIIWCGMIEECLKVAKNGNPISQTLISVWILIILVNTLPILKSMITSIFINLPVNLYFSVLSSIGKVQIYPNRWLYLYGSGRKEKRKSIRAMYG